jgi:hypothetical protein
MKGTSGVWLQARRTASRHRRALWRSSPACMAGSWHTSVSSKVLSHTVVTVLIYRKAERTFDITQLQPISCLPSCVNSRVFDSNTDRIHPLHGKKASLWLRVMCRVSSHILSTHAQMHLPSFIIFLAIHVNQLSLCVKLASCIQAS